MTPAELKERRRATGLTQVEFARMLGVSANTLARWERGAAAVGNPVLVRLAVDQMVNGVTPTPAAVMTPRNPGPPEPPRRQATALARIGGESTPFVGRQAEVAEVTRLIREARLLSLVGVGGIGKSRLALRAAEAVRAEQPQVWLVELAPVGDPALACEVVASTLHVRMPSPARPRSLAAALEDCRGLLVLDNCEHIIDAVAELAAMITQTCADVRILTTSREALRVMGETVWAVPPLSTPGDDEADPQRMLAFDAVQLFVDRAKRVLPGFEITAGNAEHVNRLCRRLEGLPLAIELAAARLPVLGPEQLASRLDDPFHVLTRPSRHGASRHRMLRAALDWSYALLTEAERKVFARLSVLAGTWRTEAAEAIAGADLPVGLDVVDVLQELVAKSLVQVVEPAAGVRRFRMLETVRGYAAERLAEEPGAGRATKRLHASYYLGEVERIQPGLISFDERQAFDAIEREYDNIRAVLAWSVSPDGDAEVGFRLAWCLFHYWTGRDARQEGRYWLARLSGTPATPSGWQVRMLWGAAGLAFRDADVHALRLWAERCDAAARHVEDPIARGCAAHAVAAAALVTGDFATARKKLQETIALAEQDDVGWLLGGALQWLAETAHADGAIDEAEALFARSTAVQRTTGGEGSALLGLGQLALHRGQHARAAEVIGRATDVAFDSGDSWAIALCIEALACLASATGRCDVAARLFGAEPSVRELFAANPTPLPAWVANRKAALEACRTALGPAGLDEGIRAGRNLSPRDLLALALESRPTQSSRSDASRTRLSRREQDVLERMADGHNNKQIAHELVISVRTVERHVAHVYAKLGAAGRADAITFALRQRLAASGEAAAVGHSWPA